jgi:putative SOS response-associated peptidase YedK
MCGRYVSPDEAALERAWQLSAPAGYRQSYNLAPSQLAPVLLPDEAGGLGLAQLVWGFQPAWAKRGWINARAETVFTSRAFAAAATGKLAEIHGRMPVVLAAADQERRLAADCSAEEAAAILSHNVAAIEVDKVSSYVNKPDHNDAACIKPLK